MDQAKDDPCSHNFSKTENKKNEETKKRSKQIGVQMKVFQNIMKEGRGWGCNHHSIEGGVKCLTNHQDFNLHNLPEWVRHQSILQKIISCYHGLRSSSEQLKLVKEVEMTLAV